MITTNNTRRSLIKQGIQNIIVRFGNKKSSNSHILKSFAIFALLCVMSIGAWGQTTVTIGTGTSADYYVPYNNFYKNGTTQILYTASEKVTVDMTGVNSMPSVFLNVSIGRLIDEKGIGAIRNNVAFTMITKQQALRLKEYIEKYSAKMAVC